MDLLIAIFSLAFLVAGIITRTIPNAVAPSRGPFWKTRSAFGSNRDYTLYVVGTILLGVGAILLAVAAIF